MDNVEIYILALICDVSEYDFIAGDWEFDKTVIELPVVVKIIKWKHDEEILNLEVPYQQVCYLESLLEE